MKSQVFVSLVLFVLFQFHCKSAETTVESTETVVPESKIGSLLPPPGGEGEVMWNEKGEEVVNHTGDLPFFQKKSEQPNELFRVYIASDEYRVRQIRSSDKIRRKVDFGGDELSKEELKRYDLLSFVDDGYVSVGLNSVTGKLEAISFDRRVPRINDIAKIIQNDASRWNYEHLSKDGTPLVTKFIISYQVRLYPNKTREEVKQMLQKKK
ncbi:MAG: hypothetical protein MUF77_06115 [Leptospira sp.]|nr:hypothetical protein [Leptospira sp.]